MKDLLKNIFKQKITFFKTCKEMPLINFRDYLNTQDLKYFTKEHKEHKDLNSVVSDFWNEYLNLTDNREVINRFSTILKIEKLVAKYSVCSIVLKCLFEFNSKYQEMETFNELIAILEKNNYKIDRKKDIYTQLEKIQQRIEGIGTQIELLKSTIKETDIQQAKSIESQLRSVSRVLELGYALEINKMTVLDWIECQKELKEYITLKQKNNGK